MTIWGISPPPPNFLFSHKAPSVLNHCCCFISHKNKRCRRVPLRHDPKHTAKHKALQHNNWIRNNNSWLLQNQPHIPTQTLSLQPFLGWNIKAIKTTTTKLNKMINLHRLHCHFYPLQTDLCPGKTSGQQQESEREGSKTMKTIPCSAASGAHAGMGLTAK